MNRQDQSGSGDADIGRLLHAAGSRERLPDDMKRRWEQQFRRELQPVLQRRKQHRRRWLMGVCASTIIAIAAIALVGSPPAVQSPEIRISHARGQNQLLAPGQGTRNVLTGQVLAPGSIIATGAEGLVALAYGRYNLRLNHHTRLVIDTDRLLLESGELYASDSATARVDRPLRIDTAQAEIRDIGTQFTVVAHLDRTVTTVRRGAVLVNTGREELRAESIPGSATRLTVGRDSGVRREQVAPAGADWQWIYQGGGDFVLEGRTAYEFLEWSVEESGLQLEFASRAAEIIARTTRLHGDISGLDPERAVGPVLATTDLAAERTADHTLRVTSTR